TDTQIDYTVDSATQKVTSTFQITTEAKESGGSLSPLPLIALYRHQWLNLASTPTSTSLFYDTSRGTMSLYEAASFTTE
ncbi:MAG: hypothetical protein ACPG8W_19540, partial [Candidatus Promineifilaceae bacterium]